MREYSITQSADATRPGRDALTLRQSAIVEQLARGLSTRQAAEALAISVNTVWAQLHDIHKRLGISHRGELMLWAIRHGFGNPPLPLRRG
jgi:two-component system NarL family response regulator